MRVWRCLFSILLSMSFCVALTAQEKFEVPACAASISGKIVGDRLLLSLPIGAKVKKGYDVDYGYYRIFYGKKKDGILLWGISGLNATSGKVPAEWLQTSEIIFDRVADSIKLVDVKGRLPNGNFWRYVGMFGEAIRYYDVPANAADYFDNILNRRCYKKYE